MLSASLLLTRAAAFAIAVTSCTAAVFSSTDGFTSSSYSSSYGGNAICISGKTYINASATNTKINYSIPDQLNATQTIQELLSPYTNIYTATNGGPANVSGSYALAARLCFPADETAAAKVNTVHLLTHGATLDSTYWDFAKGYSYIDAAAAAGYATFSYDRLGVGSSVHPDPIQVVQGALQVEILHQLVLRLRGLASSGLGGKTFSKVVGIGHSAGATFTQAVTARYPADFDAVALSGITTSTGTVAAAEAAFALVVANSQSRFRGIANGYFTFGSGQPGIQFAYFKYPYFDASILAKQTSTIQTNTLGELLTFGSIVAPAAAYTNPVYILNGANDYVFCGGNCSQPVDQNAAALAFFYPAVGAKGKSGQEPNAGHNLFLHTGATGFYANVINWVNENEL
ncbi:alpha/beta-hydrolase [Massarina eburnea CBS 473.64]|uniref:Alpha/beta-hydrolase n=1 Tax=Massarina eburnea CBS 473.64 TaxID=1395130 RepID=A0A6A6S310_9PLEO|nr:alpha/beta-hydrolase [Massarina eburnea CBS 473.64]